MNTFFVFNLLLLQKVRYFAVKCLSLTRSSVWQIILSFSSQQKQRCPAIEELLVDLIVLAMERSEENEASMMETGCQLWHHLSSHLIFFVLFQFASFPHMVMSLYTKVRNNKSVDYKIACLNLRTRNNNFKYCLMWPKQEFAVQKSVVLGYLSLKQGIGLLWFNFILGLNFIFLSLFQTHYHTLPYPKTKENEI